MAAAAAGAEADGCLRSFELYEAESVSSSPPDHNAPPRRAGVAAVLVAGWWVYVIHGAAPAGAL
jgi:hypothetical protein